MKKFVKGSLMIAGFLAALGFVLCLISAVFGGTSLLYVAKNDEYVGERLADVEEVVESYINKVNGAGWRSNKASNKLVVNGQNGTDTGRGTQIPAEGIEGLELTLGAGTFVIQEKDVADGVIDIYVQGKGDCDYYVKKNTLYMEGFKGNKLNDISENIVTLEFPAGTYFHEVDVEIGAGNMEIYGFGAKEIEAEVGAGEFYMVSTQVEELSLDIGAGNCEVHDAYAKDASINVAMGGCYYEGTIEKNLDAECGMGNIDFYLTGKETDHNYEIECNMGSISINGMEYSSLASERKIDNRAQGTFEIECNMGNVTLEFDAN